MENEDQFLLVDRKSKQIIDMLLSAPLYQKSGYVHARMATEGEEVVTVLPDGLRETKNSAHAGDHIVMNPTGEENVVSGGKFEGRYKATGEADIYHAEGFCRAILNPFGRPIRIDAPWGSTQVGDTNCMIADTCDANGSGEGEPYLIDGDIFAKTYRVV